MSNYICKVIEFNSPEQKASIALRRKILRIPLGLDFTAEELESEADQVHIGCFDGRLIIGILILVKSNADTLKMRQVAVDDTLQGKGIGKQLVAFAEQWSRANGFRNMLLHARETAVPFYLSMQYETIGERFEEVGIPHFKMFKKIF